MPIAFFNTGYKNNPFPSNTQKKLIGYVNRIGLVNIEDAVQVVAFMLEYDGGKALNFLSHTLFGGNVRVTYADFAVALHKAAETWDGKASFRADYYLSCKGVNPHVDIGLKGFSWFIETLYKDDAAVNSNLGCGNPYAVLGWVRDCVAHLGNEGLKFRGFQFPGANVHGLCTEDGAIGRNGGYVHQGVRCADDFPLPGGPGRVAANKADTQSK